MAASAITVLLVGAAAGRLDALGGAGFVAVCAADALDSREHDAVLLHAATRAELAALATRADLAPAAVDSAVVVLAVDSDESLEAQLLRGGVEAVVTEAEGEAALARAIRHAVERKRVERAARTAYATDLATGLPHEAQLLEHMNSIRI